MTYVVGIDLGTTNCAVGYRKLEADAAGGTHEILQLTAPGTVETRPLLPSFVYLPTPANFRKEVWRFPGIRKPLMSPANSPALMAPMSRHVWLHPQKAG